MRIVNWNIEWMDDWFVGGGKVGFLEDNPPKGITDVADLCERVATVIKDLDPDVLTIEEGPSDIREMNLFVRTYLTDAKGDRLFNVLIGPDGGAQKLYALVKRGGKFSNPALATDDLSLALQTPWKADIDGDHRLEGHEFNRQPLIVEGTMQNETRTLKIVTFHARSTSLNGGEALWKDPETREPFTVAALKERRRISTEAMRVRTYLNDLLNEDSNALIVVTGDFNDGPGIDYFQKHYLTYNVTDILLGSTCYPNQMFTHALLERVPVDQLYTATFYDFIDNISRRNLHLDQILVSPALSGRIRRSGIAHEEYNAGTDIDAGRRQKNVSDHRPVYIDLKPQKSTEENDD
jgi:hypothetical protein